MGGFMRSLIFILLFSSNQFVSADSFLLRTCRLTQSQHIEYRFDFDRVLYCSYSGALLDSVSIAQNLFDARKSKAILAYEDPQNAGRICEQVGAETHFDVNLQDVFCFFDDNSSISQEVLERGVEHPLNADLNRALQLQCLEPDCDL